MNRLSPSRVVLGRREFAMPAGEATPKQAAHPETVRCGSRRGFSLLEILLALAILGGAMAVLSQIAGTGTDASREARHLAVARIIAQTKLSEILLDRMVSPQGIPPTPVESFEAESISEFTYSIEVQPAPLDGLLAVRVTVQAINPNGGPALATYTLDRWMIDPLLGLEQLEAEEQAAREAATEVPL